MVKVIIVIFTTYDIGLLPFLLAFLIVGGDELNSFLIANQASIILWSNRAEWLIDHYIFAAFVALVIFSVFIENKATLTTSIIQALAGGALFHGMQLLGRMDVIERFGESIMDWAMDMENFIGNLICFNIIPIIFLIVFSPAFISAFLLEAASAGNYSLHEAFSKLQYFLYCFSTLFFTTRFALYFVTGWERESPIDIFFWFFILSFGWIVAWCLGHWGCSRIMKRDFFDMLV